MKTLQLTLTLFSLVQLAASALAVEDAVRKLTEGMALLFCIKMILFIIVVKSLSRIYQGSVRSLTCKNNVVLSELSLGWKTHV